MLKFGCILYLIAGRAAFIITLGESVEDFCLTPLCRMVLIHPLEGFFS